MSRPDATNGAPGGSVDVGTSVGPEATAGVRPRPGVIEVAAAARPRTASPAAIAPAVLGLGLARPAGRLDADAAARHAAERCGADPDVRSRVLRHARRAGIRRRASVIADELGSFYPAPADPARPGAAGPGTAARMRRYEREAPGLAAAAGARAIRAAGVDPARVTHTVLVSCTGFASPGVDHALVDRLGLPDDVERTVVGFMGCHGALNGLRTAAHAVRAEPGALVLVVAVELCSLHFAYGDDPQRIVANTLFADGAAAVVVGDPAAASAGRSRGTTTNAGVAAVHARPLAAPPVRLLAHGGGRVPGTAPLMSWRIGDDGFLMTLEPEVPDAIDTALGPWLEGWLARHGRTRGDVGGWIVHPGGPRILDAAERALGLPRHGLLESRAVLRACGNMSSPTVLFALRRALRRGMPRPIGIVGLGPGLSIEAALLG